VDEGIRAAQRLWQLSDEELVTALLTREEVLRHAYSGVLEVVAEAEQRDWLPVSGTRTRSPC
jgi:hypothetical protein